MKHVVVLVVTQMLITNAFAAVGDSCSSTACATDIEQCVASTSCECADNHINKATGVCISNGCSSGATACATNGILNTYCDTNSVCVCDALSEVSSAADNTKGACVLKACTGGGTQCSSVTNGKCSVTTGNGVCVCEDTHELKNGACAVKVYGDSCTSDANCAGISATDAVCDTSSNVCKIAVDKTCSTTTDNCVTNGECDSTTTKCKCKTNYVADSTGKLCVAENGVGIVAASLGSLLITLLLQVSLL